MTSFVRELLVYFYFADDSRQGSPSRPKMGPLVAVGGIAVPGEAVGALARGIEELCSKHGLPADEEMKWSPGRELWMWENLHDPDRRRLFLGILRLLRDHEVKVIVAVEDSARARAIRAARTPEMDATLLFLERVSKHLWRMEEEGVVIVDRPGGGREEEDTFLASCIGTLTEGTKYVEFERIVLPVLCAPSRFVRLLQVADVVTGCKCARVAGEDTYAPPVFDAVSTLMDSYDGRIGGIGLKLHPDMKYVNLYHWLVHDSLFWKGLVGHPLPIEGFPYFGGEHDPAPRGGVRKEEEDGR